MDSLRTVLNPDGMCGMCDVTRYQGDTKVLLFSSICVNIVLFSFAFKHMCKYCIVLDTERSDIKKLSQQTHCSVIF